MSVREIRGSNFCILCGRRHLFAESCGRSKPQAERVPTLHPDDIMDELIATKGELAAANQSIAHLNTALATAHSALLAGEFERAMEIILITINPRGRQ